MTRENILWHSPRRRRRCPCSMADRRPRAFSIFVSILRLWHPSTKSGHKIRDDSCLKPCNGRRHKFVTCRVPPRPRFGSRKSLAIQQGGLETHTYDCQLAFAGASEGGTASPPAHPGVWWGPRRSGICRSPVAAPTVLGSAAPVPAAGSSTARRSPASLQTGYIRLCCGGPWR